jgi:hypothetical protein
MHANQGENHDSASPISQSSNAAQKSTQADSTHAKSALTNPSEALSLATQRSANHTAHTTDVFQQSVSDSSNAIIPNTESLNQKSIDTEALPSDPVKQHIGARQVPNMAESIQHDTQILNVARPATQSMKTGTSALPMAEINTKGAQPHTLKAMSIAAYKGSMSRLFRIAVIQKAAANKIGNDDRNANQPGQGITYNDLVVALLSKVSVWRPNTWRNHRSALKFWLHGQPFTVSIQGALDKLADETPRTGFKGNKSGAVTTIYSKTAVRKRTVPPRNLERMLKFLDDHSENSSVRTPRQLAIWIRAGLATGLRPCEWEGADWANYDNAILDVKNRKRHDGMMAMPNIAPSRAAESHRSIQVNGISRFAVSNGVDKEEFDDRYWVNLHLRNVMEHLESGNSYKSYYERVRQYLIVANQQVFKNRTDFITLYQLRGQFAANRKKAKGVEGAAADLGINPHTAIGYYGNKQYAHNTKGIMESDNELSAEQIAANQSSGPRPSAQTPIEPTQIVSEQSADDSTGEASQKRGRASGVGSLTGSGAVNSAWCNENKYR